MLHAISLAAVTWDPTIRGIAVVVVGCSVLMGSVWLVLMTNSGVRVASLLAISAFFGWMTIMGTVWWIYGIGWKGKDPSWQTIEVIRQDPAQSSLDNVQTLPNPSTLPTGFEVASASSSPEVQKEFTTVPSADDLKGLSADEAAAAKNNQDAKNRGTSLSEVASVAPAEVDQQLADKGVDLGGWKLMPTSRSGEADASASAELIKLKVDGIASTSDFKLQNRFEQGGKDRLPENPSQWDRVKRKIHNFIFFRHPPHYVVVEAQKVIPKVAKDGAAPPTPQADPNQPVLSVVMERDLGSRRLNPALVTIASLLFFIVSAYLLHARDAEAMRRRVALNPGKK
jgi:hypothetical protein